MLGEQIWESRGKTAGVRILPGGKWEVSFQESGRMLGIETNNMGTYEAIARPDGTLYGGGQGVGMTKEGDVIMWTGQGVGKPTGRGMGASWRGSIYFQTTSPRFARLNGTAGVYEYEIDENGNQTGKIWEWK